MSDKTCTKCLSPKPETDFYADKTGQNGLRASCKACTVATMLTPKNKQNNADRMQQKYRSYTPQQLIDKNNKLRLWKTENPEKVKDHELKKYGITSKDYEAMQTAQNNICAICPRGPDKTRPLAVDHNHRTGVVRGLLCYRCNREMAIVDDDERLSRALTYRNRKAA